MTRYFCSQCRQEFEADQDRCPSCLRTSTVRPVLATEVGVKPAALLRWPVILVASAVIVPWLVIEPRRPWWQTFLIALVGFGVGHAVDHAWRHWRRKA
jgi:hypothetical protein